jgi:hypothetical protein
MPNDSLFTATVTPITTLEMFQASVNRLNDLCALLSSDEADRLAIPPGNLLSTPRIIGRLCQEISAFLYRGEKVGSLSLSNTLLCFSNVIFKGCMAYLDEVSLERVWMLAYRYMHDSPDQIDGQMAIMILYTLAEFCKKSRQSDGDSPRLALADYFGPYANLIALFAQSVLNDCDALDIESYTPFFTALNCFAECQRELLHAIPADTLHLIVSDVLKIEPEERSEPFCALLLEFSTLLSHLVEGISAPDLKAAEFSQWRETISALFTRYQLQHVLDARIYRPFVSLNRCDSLSLFFMPPLSAKDTLRMTSDLAEHLQKAPVGAVWTKPLNELYAAAKVVLGDRTLSFNEMLKFVHDLVRIHYLDQQYFQNRVLKQTCLAPEALMRFHQCIDALLLACIKHQACGLDEAANLLQVSRELLLVRGTLKLSPPVMHEIDERLSSRASEIPINNINSAIILLRATFDCSNYLEKFPNHILDLVCKTLAKAQYVGDVASPLHREMLNQCLKRSDVINKLSPQGVRALPDLMSWVAEFNAHPTGAPT